MPRYRRRRERDWGEALPPLAGLFILGWTLSPQFRFIAVSAIVFALALGAIILAVYIMRKKTHHADKAKVDEYVPISQSPASLRRSRTFQSEQPTHQDDTRYQPRISTPFSETPAEPSPPSVFTPELLSALEWRRFEILVTLFFQKTGYEAQRGGVGADGGVDIIIRHAGESQPSGYVQCKALNSSVGVKLIREFFGVMASDKIPHGFFVTTSDFTFDAIEFARDKSLVLVNGADLLKDLNGLPEATLRALITEITTGDYTTPTCPGCDIKMIQKQGPTGPFWGCSNYPRCHRTLNIRSH